MLDRRKFIASSALLAGATFGPKVAFARAETQKRFIFIIQRGAADGLGTVGAVGDPYFESLRGSLAQDFKGGRKLDSTFTLHPALSGVGDLFTRKEALFIHAVASPYRDRSHFDGQDVLERGSVKPHQLTTGWLNRLIPLLDSGGARALAFGATMPAALQGKNPATTYGFSSFRDASNATLERVAEMYQGDMQLHPLWTEAVAAERLARAAGKTDRTRKLTGEFVAKMIGSENGPRIAMIETDDWDTHYGQSRRLQSRLRELDSLITGLRSGLGQTWKDSLVLVATEFGRTAAVNGTGGTDHGQGSVAMLFGGTLAGGKVVADFPGLGKTELYEGRDLRPTLRLDNLISSAISQHFALDAQLVSKALFPFTRTRIQTLFDGLVSSA
ncbi:DUF1501 domain-containing protein [Altererythrobacter indicus]|uniref:DUF1501 domain-containing protein n=1 Tax=Altericroceibacterium indicum TaxID=374177 RepID=A0A845AEP0_9SPHN|nr:DUF1501 domain-containing protein [Altericroceibacterium indicum]MXP27016.1 DUF1501 domain-containing protein [Altericroceibacterium indicum]